MPAWGVLALLASWQSLSTWQTSYTYLVPSADLASCLIDMLPLDTTSELTSSVLFRITVVIPRNAQLPTRRTRVFSTAFDNQSTIKLKVIAGERPVALGYDFIGELEVPVATSPRGVPQIKVSFTFIHDGTSYMLKVTVEDGISGLQLCTHRAFLRRGLLDDPETSKRHLAAAQQFQEQDIAASESIKEQLALKSLDGTLPVVGEMAVVEDSNEDVKSVSPKRAMFLQTRILTSFQVSNHDEL